MNEVTSVSNCGFKGHEQQTNTHKRKVKNGTHCKINK